MKGKKNMKEILCQVLNYDPQPFEVVESIYDIKESGTYAVKGYKHLVTVEKVTPYGQECLSKSYLDIKFVTLADGETYYVLETGFKVDWAQK